MNSGTDPSEAREWLESFGKPERSEEFSASIHPEGEFLGWGVTVQGRAGWLETRALFLRVFDPLEITVVDLVEEPGVASGHARMAAKHCRSGREVDLFFSFFLRWQDGKIIWMRSLLDRASLLAQLNLFEPRRWDVVFES